MPRGPVQRELRNGVTSQPTWRGHLGGCAPTSKSGSIPHRASRHQNQGVLSCPPHVFKPSRHHIPATVPQGCNAIGLSTRAGNTDHIVVSCCPATYNSPTCPTLADVPCHCHLAPHTRGTVTAARVHEGRPHVASVSTLISAVLWYPSISMARRSVCIAPSTSEVPPGARATSAARLCTASTSSTCAAESARTAACMHQCAHGLAPGQCQSARPGGCHQVGTGIARTRIFAGGQCRSTMV